MKDHVLFICLHQASRGAYHIFHDAMHYSVSGKRAHVSEAALINSERVGICGCQVLLGSLVACDRARAILASYKLLA